MWQKSKEYLISDDLPSGEFLDLLADLQHWVLGGKHRSLCLSVYDLNFMDIN